MKYRFDGINYDVIIRDFPYDGEYYRRNFELKHEIEKGYCFTVKYMLENNFPKCYYVREHTGAFPELEQADILERSLEIKSPKCFR